MGREDGGYVHGLFYTMNTATVWATSENCELG
jgi:hypothetical protein